MYDYSEIFALSDAYSESIVRAGSWNILVIDNFYKSPDKVRSLALSLEYGLNLSQRQFRFYPGKRATVSHHPEKLFQTVISRYHSIDTAITSKLSSWHRQPVVFSLLSGDEVRNLHPKQRVPHVDSSSLVGVICLTPSEYCNGGTAFYRHRVTGLDYLPPCPNRDVVQAMISYGFNPLDSDSYIEFKKTICFDALGDTSNIVGHTGFPCSTKTWEVLALAPVMYNRLIVFPGHLLHSPVYNSTGASNCREHRRLTQNIVFIPT